MKLTKLNVISRRPKVFMLALLFILVIVPLVSAEACKHRRKPIIGKMELDYVGGIFDLEGRELTWRGTISGRVNGEMLFWNALLEDLGNGWLYFEERWEIYDGAKLLLAGWDKGYVTPEWKYAMSGRVTEATPKMCGYIGHRVIMFGHINLGPNGLESAPGVFLLL